MFGQSLLAATSILAKYVSAELFVYSVRACSVGGLCCLADALAYWACSDYFIYSVHSAKHTSLILAYLTYLTWLRFEQFLCQRTPFQRILCQSLVWQTQFMKTLV